MKYYNVKNFIPLLFNINPVESVVKNSGDIVIKITDINLNPEYDASFDLPEMSKFGIKTTVKDIKAEMEKQKAQFKELNNAMNELKSLTNELKNMSNDFEESEESEAEE